MAQAGADIVIWGTRADAEPGGRGASSTNLGVRVLAQQVDVADEAAVVAAMAEAIDGMGRVDTVIANAGIGVGAPSFSEMTVEIWRRNMAVNLDGAFFTCREACRHMVERAKAGDPGGSIAVTASLAAVDGAARNEAYAATKGGVIAMMKAIAVEHARYGVRANAILPGWIATDMTAGAQGSDGVQRQGHHPRADPPLGRAGGLRRHRRLPGLGRLEVPHRRQLPHRRRLRDLLRRASAAFA